MMYMKRFPEKREPFFWNVVSCELAGLDGKSSETDRKILRPLAYGFLSRVVADLEVKHPTVSFSYCLLIGTCH
jgi:hypothetical protein